MGQDRVGAPPKKRSKSPLVDMQRRLKNLCEEYASGTTAVEDFQRAVDHTIWF